MLFSGEVSPKKHLLKRESLLKETTVLKSRKDNDRREIKRIEKYSKNSEDKLNRLNEEDLQSNRITLSEKSRPEEIHLEEVILHSHQRKIMPTISLNNLISTTLWIWVTLTECHFKSK